MSRPRLIALLLALAALLVYLSVVHFDFVTFDDKDYINETVQKGLTFANIKWAFTTDHSANWHPVTWLSHMMDCELFGLNAGAFHFVNILFHAANSVLLFALLFRLTNVLWPSAFIAALFAWHPLHVESVAWIAERKDVLSTFFALLALLSYLKYARENCRRSFWFALTFFALGLMSKPMVVTLPCVMLLLDYWPLNRISISKLSGFPRAVVLEKWPFFLLAALSCAATFLAQRYGGAVMPLKQFPLDLRLENALIAYGRYLLMTIWPIHLAAFYPLSAHLHWMCLIASVAALSFISWLGWRGRETRPYLLVGWLWFLGTLVPAIGFVQVGGAALADRYTYFPLIGIFIAVTFGMADLAKRFQIPQIVLAAAAIFILATCLMLTENQLRYWQDGETLFTHSLAVTPDNEPARVNLGVALEEKGKIKEALVQYRVAEKLAPEIYLVHNNLGDMLDNLGEREEALAEYRQAIQLNPGLSLLHNGAGIVLTELGRFPEAMAEFTNAIRLDPAYAAPHFRLGDALLKQGRDAGAIVQFKEALQLDPLNYQTLVLTAHILASIEDPKVRDGKTALILALKANELSGHNQPMVFDILGMALAENGDFTNAVICAQNALELANAAKMKRLEPIQQRLGLYKNHQPWRESFLATNNADVIHP